jgi:hypothetical protein
MTAQKNMQFLMIFALSGVYLIRGAECLSYREEFDSQYADYAVAEDDYSTSNLPDSCFR